VAQLHERCDDDDDDDDDDDRTHLKGKPVPSQARGAQRVPGS